MLARTWRLRVLHGEHLEQLRADRQPFVFALWHGQMLPLLWQHRGDGIAILISDHDDGEIIARAARSLGLSAVRGSTSHGGRRALLGLVRALRDGQEIAVTPDGPRGPSHTFAPGALVVACRGNAPVLLLAAAADRAWRLRSWDGFMIPKPFSRVSIVYAPPQVVPECVREAAAAGPRFEALLEALSIDAQAAVV
jgi:lysophospholipid acyltransferase (LPLAT)-like uncharacterized protein